MHPRPNTSGLLFYAPTFCRSLLLATVKNNDASIFIRGASYRLNLIYRTQIIIPLPAKRFDPSIGKYLTTPTKRVLADMKELSQNVTLKGLLYIYLRWAKLRPRYKEIHEGKKEVKMKNRSEVEIAKL
jgi:hypothetical protein